MKLNIIQIGNSYGIRIPKAILKQCGFEETVIVHVDNGNLIISPDKKVSRVGWSEVFQSMRAAGDDMLLDGDLIDNDFDRDEWEW